MTSPEQPETSGQDAVSDEAIEAAARALWDDLRSNFMGRWMPEWADAKAGEQDAARDSARAILTAAAPHIRADEFNRQLARLRRAADQFAAGTQSTPGVSWVAGFRAAIEYLSAPDGPGDATAPDAPATIDAAGRTGSGAVVGTGEASEASEATVGEPIRMPAAKVRAAYDALGLDPEAWNRTARIEITARTVTVTRNLRNENGRMHLGEDGKVATDVDVIEIDWSGMWA